MSKSYDNLREDFIFNRDHPEYRHAYAEESLDLSVGTQIKVLREQRDWRQEDLAHEAQIQQPMVSRYENVNYSNWSINTLKKLARAFDVWLDVRFRSFGELVTTTEDFSRESLQVPKFADDSFFKTRRLRMKWKPRPSKVQIIDVSVKATGTGVSAAQLGLQFESVASPALGKLISWPNAVRPIPDAFAFPKTAASAGAGVKTYGTTNYR